MRIPLAILAGIAALAVPALPQEVQSRTLSATIPANGAIQGAMSFPGHHFFAAVTGAAYSAERVSEHVQTAADGTRFTSASRTREYRDSQGRTRTERPLMPGNADGPVIVEISDPVANAGYVLDAQNKVAHRFALEVHPMRQPASTPRSTTASAAVNGSTRPRPQFATEDLGQQMMEGVMAQGHRTTQTWPAGSRGNDRPFQSTSESWYSADIRETVLTKSEDALMGENTMKLINISRAEPDPSLFLPPADYTVMDETGPFQIQWTAARQ